MSTLKQIKSLDISNLKGDVKSIAIYKSENGSDRKLTEKNYYNIEHHTMTMEEYDNAEKLFRKIISQHDENDDKLLEQTSYRYDNQGKEILEMKAHFTFDNNGKCMEDYAEIYNFDKISVKKTLYFYNENGEKIGQESYENDNMYEKIVLENDEKHQKIIRYDRDGSIKREEILKYDENRKAIGREVYENNALIFIRTISYHQNGEILEDIVENKKTDMKHKNNYHYEYNTQGNLIKKSGVRVYLNNDDSEPYSRSYTYSYDDNKHLIEEVSFFGGELNERILYKYDEKGNVSEKLTYDRYNLNEKDTYAYDVFGNLIKHENYYPAFEDENFNTKFQDKKTTEYEIEYFNNKK